jgi:hypothetical protein
MSVCTICYGHLQNKYEPLKYHARHKTWACLECYSDLDKLDPNMQPPKENDGQDSGAVQQDDQPADGPPEEVR